MSGSDTQGHIDERKLSERRDSNSKGNYVEERRFIMDRRNEKSPEVVPTAWPFADDISKE